MRIPSTIIVCCMLCLAIGDRCRKEELFKIQHWASLQFVYIDPARQYLNVRRNFFNGQVFCFKRMTGPWGFIQHAHSDMIVHPASSNSHQPRNGDMLILSGSRNMGALFADDEGRKCIRHKSGMCIHVHNGRTVPDEGEHLVLHWGYHDAMRFSVVDPFSWPVKPSKLYDAPVPGGYWKLVNAVINPKMTHKLTIHYTVGKSKSVSSSITNSISFSWETSAGFKEMFSSKLSGTISTILMQTDTSTWSSQQSETRTITIPKGKTCATWQWIYHLRKFNETLYEFGSNVLTDTYTIDQRPAIWLDTNALIKSKASTVTGTNNGFLVFWFCLTVHSGAQWVISH